jgi:hypothetical protein
MKKAIHNCRTGEVKIVDMTPEEIVEREAEEAKAAAREIAKANAETKRVAALAKFEKLGLTEDDLNALRQ